MRRWFAVFFLIVLTGSVIRQIQIETDSVYIGQRGPYLQKLTPSSVVVRWQTLNPATTRLQLGAQTIQQPDKLTTNHRVELRHLTPASSYHYSIGSNPDANNGEHMFTTPPDFGERTQSVRLWVLGDPGADSKLHLAARTAGQQWLQQNARIERPLLDVWITTGDNAYTSGRNREFQQAIFDPYKDWLSRFNLVPVIGNHDIRRRAYRRIFEFPEAAEQGGLASGSQHYYSLDQGALHLLVLDTAWAIIHDRQAMLEWLEKDLLANVRPWSVVVFHHAPYSKGSHDSDDIRGSDRRVGMVRKHILPILELHNVDLVISGHSHVYERSHLLNGHYGKSETFSESMLVSRGQGKQDRFSKEADCEANCGTVYQVLGSTSELRPGALNHPAIAIGLNQGGTISIDVEQGCLSSRFINIQGEEADFFTINKNSNCQ